MLCFDWMAILFVFAAANVNLNQRQVPKVINGTIARKGEFPWLVAIKELPHPGDYCASCTGSLIKSDFVLTTGHCCESDIPDELRSAIAKREGETDQKIHVKSKYPYPCYLEPDLKMAMYDLCILELESPFTLNNYVKTIELAPPSEDWTKWDSKNVIGLGYGVIYVTYDENKNAIQHDNTNWTLKFGTGKVIPQDEWYKWVTPYPASWWVIFVMGNGTTVCSGDSGGPLLYKNEDGNYIQIGIAVEVKEDINGQICTSDTLFQLYTRVDVHRNWIARVLEERNNVPAECTPEKTIVPDTEPQPTEASDRISIHNVLLLIFIICIASPQ